MTGPHSWRSLQSVMVVTLHVAAVAYVIRRAGCSVEAEDLKAHVLTQLARFKVPRDIVFVDDLPRTALGKVQHFMLKRLDTAEATQGDAN